MSRSEEAMALGLSTSDVAWPVVLAVCVAIMVLPFVFLVVAVVRPEAEEAGVEPPG